MWAGNDEGSKESGQEMLMVWIVWRGGLRSRLKQKKNENVCFEKSDNVFGDVWIEKEKEEEWMNR